MKKRVIEFEGILNFRDIGGYRARDGGCVRWGMVFRSGDLSAATDKDLQRITELRIRIVIDLRGADSVEEKTDKL